jgi:hypothetical protein
LRIPDVEFTEKSHLPQHYLPVYRAKTDRIARIRELHVYGNIVSASSTGQSQHRGIGKFLIHVAEFISSMYDCTLITIISGVGVRDYYEHLGYTLDDHEDQFMVKRYSTGGKDTQSQPLLLFGKQYMREEIVDALQHTLIHTTYLAPLLQQSVYSTRIVKCLSSSYRHHVYELIQRGEAEGFAFTGKEVVTEPIEEKEQIKEKEEQLEEKEELQLKTTNEINTAIKRKQSDMLCYIIAFIMLSIIFHTISYNVTATK